MPGEDVQTFERDLPGQNTAGFNTKYVSSDIPLESSDTLNGAWGFNIGDSNYKSAAELERSAGPRRRKQFQPAAEYRTLSQWRDRCPIRDAPARGRRMAIKIRRVHLRNPRRADRSGRLGSDDAKGQQDLRPRPGLGSPLLALASVPGKITAAELFADGKKLDVTQNQDGIILKLPAPKSDEVDRVVVLTVSK